MTFHVITIFPEVFDSYLKESIIGRAIKNKKIKIRFYNPMDFCPPKERVDGRPYGGGPGMVLRPEPLLKTLEKVFSKLKVSAIGGSASGGKSGKLKVINFIPNARKFDTAYAKLHARKYTDLVLICGRYEGIDARISKIIKNWKLKIDNLSIGDYVLTGGELPAMILIDSISRQIPGVLGKYESLEEERVSSSEVYTRPERLVYKGKSYKVPKVLLSGHHKRINEWKKRAG